MDSLELSEIMTRRNNLDFEMLKINVQFDLSQIKTRVEKILKQHTPVTKDGYNTYAGVGLQYQDSKNPIYDCVEQSSYIDSDGQMQRFRDQGPFSFTQKNELAEQLGFVFEKFSPIPLYRGRILRAAPGHRHAVHIDGKTDCRIHIPVITNLYSLMYFGGRPYHMPADGSAYLCNTSRPHHFVNLGDEERTHIVFVI